MRKPMEFERHPTPYAVAQSRGLFRAIGDAVVHDGDTLNAMADLGFSIFAFPEIRILGVNAYELSQPLGPAARDFATLYLARQPLLIRTKMTSGGVESQSFTRYLADIYVNPTPAGDGVLFAPLLIAAGLGVPA